MSFENKSFEKININDEDEVTKILQIFSSDENNEFVPIKKNIKKKRSIVLNYSVDSDTF